MKLIREYLETANILAQMEEEDFEKKAKEKGATKIISEEIYDWNVGFFVKAGYQVAGELKDLPKGHTLYIVDKDL